MTAGLYLAVTGLILVLAPVLGLLRKFDLSDIVERTDEVLAGALGGGGGFISEPHNVLIADAVFHAECWDALVAEHQPGDPALTEDVPADLGDPSPPLERT